ncbi:Peptide transporter [Lachnellula willkommii]|uniref:Peptide transporter n=1 Tax=Lachnellula willkommii TaxID=215461 RepID=A0A559M9H0_9HELO|nr:Peptide transporter [Lachnellula willkommii]
MDDTFTTATSEVVAGDDDNHHDTLKPIHHNMDDNGHIFPTREELDTLPRVAGTMPWSAYLLCGVEFAERASYYGCRQVFKNFIRGPLPEGGNGAGAPPRGSQKTAGALGKGTVIASASKITEISFPNSVLLGNPPSSMELVPKRDTGMAMYRGSEELPCLFRARSIHFLFKSVARAGLPASSQSPLLVANYPISKYHVTHVARPIFGGWLADSKLGQFKTICIGVAICGVAHVIMIISAIPYILQAGYAIGPFALSLYMLAVGAALFKPNVAPTILDQNPHRKPHVVTRRNGSKVIVDPEASSESVMLWFRFYLVINLGGFVGVATAYLAKYVGFWASYLLPGVIYFMLPTLLFFVNKRLIKVTPGGSALGNFVSVNLLALRKAGISQFGRAGYWDRVKPSELAKEGKVVKWTDDFINDGALGAAANAQSASLTSNGVPNDVLDNVNPFVIIILIPIMNHGIYPLLRKLGIRFGPIARMTFGFLIASIGASSYAVIQHYIYNTSPCGYSASTCNIADGVSHLSLWLYAIPVGVTACCEVFVIVTAYGIAYSRSPPHMRGFVMALALSMTAVSTAISMATADALQDPYLRSSEEEYYSSSYEKTARRNAVR